MASHSFSSPTESNGENMMKSVPNNHTYPSSPSLNANSPPVTGLDSANPSFINDIISSLPSFSPKGEAKRKKRKPLYGTHPSSRLGPKAVLLEGTHHNELIDPLNFSLVWTQKPLTVLIVRKIRDFEVILPFVELIQWLIKEKNMIVFVEASCRDDSLLTENATFDSIKKIIRFYPDSTCIDFKQIDLVICLGGDGTLLHASSMFQESIPPVVAFHCGSVGFLTPVKLEDYASKLNDVFLGNFSLSLRTRLRCRLISDSSDSSSNANSEHVILNDCVIDRGMFGNLCHVDIYIDKRHVTTLHGDGIIIATPTGSTAYAMAAGSSLCHPSLPAILIVPICPHSLSFRPVIVPAGVEITIAVPKDARNSSAITFDGRDRVELKKGEMMKITTSNHPMPCVCAADTISDWFTSLGKCLHWNAREAQKPLLSPSSSEYAIESGDS